MTCEKELYGADADGNRGQWIWEYEIEKSDRDEIVDQIHTFIEQNEIEEDDMPSTCKILLSCDRTGEEVEFEVEISDYL
jgi:hypothetical protein